MGDLRNPKDIYRYILSSKLRGVRETLIEIQVDHLYDKMSKVIKKINLDLRKPVLKWHANWNSSETSLYQIEFNLHYPEHLNVPSHEDVDKLINHVNSNLGEEVIMSPTPLDTLDPDDHIIYLVSPSHLIKRYITQ